MGIPACGICADRHQHDDARPGAAVFHPPLESNGWPGGTVFFDAIFWKFFGDAGNKLAVAAAWFFESDQRGVFLFRTWIGVPGAWSVVFFDGVRGDLRDRV